MFMEERQQAIAERIRTNGKITVAEIAETFGVSEESARRDLRLLEQKGVCQRTHGGAVSSRQVGFRPPSGRDFAHMPVFDNYREISRAAVSRICENDTVYLTSGSFGHIMLSFLPRDISYTVVVNSVELGSVLRSFDNIDVYVAGGKMRPSGSLVDNLANAFVSRMHFDLCFLTDETAAFQRTVLQNSRRKCLLMPGAKIGADSFIKVCDMDAFDLLITDWDCVEEQLAAIEEKGVEVIVVEKLE